MTTTVTRAKRAETGRVAQPNERAEPPADRALPLSLEAIDLTLEHKQVLRDVSLSVRRGEIVCLLGPSGCGKTTLLRVAAGIERQDAGVVRVAGDVVADARRFVPAEARRLGLVFQDLALFPHMRVADNVAYGVRRSRRAEAEADALEALAQVGLRGHARDFPHQLSGGEQQRVALVRALLPDPKVVLFDEPFSALDRGLRQSVREDTLAILRARAATAVIVTHDPEEALAIADRIALMRHGTIVQTATPEEIWRAPVDLEAAEVFSRLNVFAGRTRGGALETPLGPVPVGSALDNAQVTVAFRPEALRVLPIHLQPGVEATVTSRRFFGTFVEIGARIGEATLTLRADPFEAPQGDVVRVVPDVRQAIVHAAPSSAPAPVGPGGERRGAPAMGAEASNRALSE